MSIIIFIKPRQHVMKETFMTTNSENPEKKNPSEKDSSKKLPLTPDRGSNGGSTKPPPDVYSPQKKTDKL